MSDYQDYLKTSQWGELSRQARERAGDKCETCGSSPGHVHHVKYPKRFDEDHVDNLVVLCRRCHGLMHGIREGADKTLPVIDYIGDWITEADRDPECGHISTGFDSIDAMLGGIGLGRFYLLAGRSGTGRSSLALNIAKNIATKTGKSVLYISLQSLAKDLSIRLLSNIASIPANDIADFNIPKNDYGRIANAVGELKQLPLFVDDSGAMTISDLVSLIREFAIKQTTAMVVIDSLDMVDSKEWGKSAKARDVAVSLKSVAKASGAPILAIANTSAESEKRADQRPSPQDFGDSRIIYDLSDVVLFSHMSHDTPDLELIISKNLGPVGTIHFDCDFSRCQFSHLDAPRKKESGLGFNYHDFTDEV